MGRRSALSSYQLQPPWRLPEGSEVLIMPETPDAIRGTAVERYCRIAKSAAQEKKFPVGPNSAKTLSYEPQEIDNLPARVRIVLRRRQPARVRSDSGWPDRARRW